MMDDLNKLQNHLEDMNLESLQKSLEQMANNLEEILEIDKVSRIFAKKISEKFYV